MSRKWGTIWAVYWIMLFLTFGYSVNHSFKDYKTIDKGGYSLMVAMVWPFYWPTQFFKGEN